MGKHRSRQFWRGAVAEYEESGLTASEFASGLGLNARTLKWWASRFRGEGRARGGAGPSGFVEVARVDRPPVVQKPAELGLAGPAVSIRVGGGVILVFGELPPAQYVAAMARYYDGVAP